MRPTSGQWLDAFKKLTKAVERTANAGERIADGVENIAAAFQTADAVDTKPEIPGVTEAGD